MPREYVKFSFSAGELSEELYGRGDLEGFNSGFRKGDNVMVDWRGGLQTRPGTLTCEPLWENKDNPGVRLSSLSINASEENNYLLVWKHRQLFLVYKGFYMLERDFEVNPDPLSNAAFNALADNSLVAVFNDTDDSYLYTGQIDRPTGVNTAKIHPAPGMASRALEAGEEAFKIITITTPYNAGELNELRFHTRGNTLLIVHPRHAPRQLQIVTDVIPTIDVVNFVEERHAGTLDSEEVDRTTDFQNNEGGFQWTVATVADTGQEYPVALSYGKLEEEVDIGEKIINLEWPRDAAEPPAKRYRVYASPFKADFTETLDAGVGRGGASAVRFAPDGTDDPSSATITFRQEVYLQNPFRISVPEAVGGGRRGVTYSVAIDQALRDVGMIVISNPPVLDLATAGTFFTGTARGNVTITATAVSDVSNSAQLVLPFNVVADPGITKGPQSPYWPAIIAIGRTWVVMAQARIVNSFNSNDRITRMRFVTNSRSYYTNYHTIYMTGLTPNTTYSFNQTASNRRQSTGFGNYSRNPTFKTLP